MKHFIRNINHLYIATNSLYQYKNWIVVVWVFFFSPAAIAQTPSVVGQNPAINNGTYTYTFSSTATFGTFSVTGGTLNSSSKTTGACGSIGVESVQSVKTLQSLSPQSPPGGGGGGGTTYCYSASVHWGGGTSGTISFKDNGGTVVGTSTVTLCPSTISVPSAVFSTIGKCGTKQISYTGAPPNGNTTWYWQTSSTGTDMGNSSNLYYVNASGNYYLRAYYSVCSMWSDAVAVNSNSGYVQFNAIPSPSPTDDVRPPFCGTQSTTISATPGANANSINWYTTFSGGSPVGTGTSYTTPPLSSTTTYYVASYNSSADCESAGARGTVTVQVNPIPAAIISPNQVTLCSGGSTTISVTSSISGTTLSWTAQKTNATIPAGSGTGNISGTFSNTDQVNPGSVTYTVTPSTTACTGTPATATITINNRPAAPSVTNATICHFATGTLYASVGAGGSTLNWYTSSSGGTAFYHGNALTITDEVGNLATTNYYVSTVNTTTGCESARQTVTLTVNPAAIPGLPASVTNGSTCGPGTALLSAAVGSNGNDIHWRDGMSQLVATGTSYSPSVSTTTTYYAYNYNSSTGCESQYNQQATAYVNPIPTAGVSPSAVTLCSRSSSTITLSNPNSVSGTTFSWTAQSVNANFTAASGTGNITDTFYNADQVNSGTVVYTVIPTAAGCSGPPATATVTIKNTPATPVPGTFVAYAYGKPVTLRIAIPDGQQATWYPFTSAPVTGATYSYTPVANPEPEGSDILTVSLKDMNTLCESPQAYINVIMTSPINPGSVVKETIRTSGAQHYADVDLVTIQKAKSVTFMDGLGRGIQAIAINATSTGKDLVQPVEYDSYGRSSKSYLPYSAATTGAYQNTYVADQLNFYSSSSPAGDKVVNDNFPFAVATYEASPLGRQLEQGTPGNNGQPGVHTKKVAYSFNTGIQTTDDREEVRIIKSDGNSGGFYTAGLLSKVTTTDENGNLSITFTNALGKTVAFKQQKDATTWLQTYYVYDDFNRLKYIIPPAGFNYWKTNGWSQTSLADTYCHQFVYDNRDRLIQKKTPGQAWSYFVYDNLNRPILSQDGNQRLLGKWTFAKYDLMGRTVMSGLYVNSALTDQATAQTAVNNFYASPSTVYYEKPGTTLYGYTNVSFPTANGDNSPLEVWNVTYYDNYNFTMNNGSAPVYDIAHLSGLDAQTTYLRGHVTGTRKRIVNTANWIVSAVFYDKYGRVIQTQSNNHLNLTGIDKASSVYDFEKVTATKVTHSSDGTTITNIVQTPVYDAQGRLSQIKHNINGQGDQVVAQYEYNELGQMVDKKLHYSATLGNFLQSVDYRYNILGRLTSINNAQLVNDASATNDETNDYFGLELFYDNSESSSLGNNPLYNGNISAVKWKNAGVVAGAADQRSYKFAYDKANQLTNASFNANTGSAWTKESGTLDESVTNYDLNGNIINLTRNQNNRGLSGATVTSAAQAIDNLTYTYASGNQLSKVTDAASTSGGFADGANATTEYTYDTHGNLTSDANKGIDSLKYNALGKAARIKFHDGRLVTYTYDAGGNKLTTATTVSGTITKTDYTNGFVYNTSGSTRSLSFFSSPEGRVIKNSGGNFEYQYAIADHQGNTRVLFTSAPQTSQSVTATFEAANQPPEASQFSNYGHISAGHSNGTYSQYLNGGYAGMVGVAKSYKVFPGDQLKIEAYGSYNTPGSNGSSLASFAGALLTAFNLAPPGSGETGTASSGINTWGGIEAAGFGDGTNDNADPKAFVNIVLFDKNYNFLDVAYAQLKGTSLYYMTANYTVKEAGYAYLYVSNEQANQTDVYFDDVTMTYTPTNILQNNEYYPFGLQTAGSWTRDNTTNNFLYDAGNELNSMTGMYDLPFRNYDAALGRFFQVDQLATTSHNITPYHYAGNNPVIANDPTGLVIEYFANPEDDPRNWRMFVTNGVCQDDAWSYSINFGGGGSAGSAAASLDEAANVAQYFDNLASARMDAYSANANADGFMLTGAGAQLLVGTLQKGGSVDFNMDGTVEYRSQLSRGDMASMAGSLDDSWNVSGLTQSGITADDVRAYAAKAFGWSPGNINIRFDVPEGYGYELETNGTFSGRRGVTDWRRDANGTAIDGKVDIFLSPSALVNFRQLFLTLGHEMVHANDRLSFGIDNFSSGASEYNAYSWSIEAATGYGPVWSSVVEDYQESRANPNYKPNPAYNYNVTTKYVYP